MKIIFQLGVCPGCLCWYFTRGCVFLQCVLIMYENIWLFLSRLKSVKWWPLRRNPCGLSLNVRTRQLYPTRPLGLSLNMAMICAKTCSFYRYATVKDFFSIIWKNISSMLDLKKMPSTDSIPILLSCMMNSDYIIVSLGWVRLWTIQYAI